MENVFLLSVMKYQNKILFRYLKLVILAQSVCLDLDLKKNASSLSLHCFSLSRFNFENETPTTNFDTFPAAILTVFQVRSLFFSAPRAAEAPLSK